MFDQAKSFTNLLILKGLVHPKMKIMSLMTIRYTVLFQKGNKDIIKVVPTHSHPKASPLTMLQYLTF